MDMTKADISDATVVLFWFTDPALIGKMERKFKKQLRAGSRIITVWAPLGMNLPHKMDFPFFICKLPFKKAKSVRQQIKAIYGNECIDFTAAWLLAERYIDKLESVPEAYRRFVNIMLSMVIWTNGWNMGIACEEEVPPPVETYIGILKTFFDIDLSQMIKTASKPRK